MDNITKDDTQSFTSEKWQTDWMCPEKKAEEDSPVLKMARIHQYDDAKTILKKKQQRKRPVTTLTTERQRDQQ